MADVDRIVAYLKANVVMALCTALEGRPWAANCFYAFDAEAVRFLFLTHEETRHGREMLENARVAGTVSSQQASVAKIRGVQFTGTARLLEGTERTEARRIYDRRFPFARLSPAPVWAVVVAELKFTDNTFGFGTKLHWRRPD